MSMRMVRAVALISFVLGGVGCAALTVEEKPFPAPPFPRWVGQLETGHTDIEQVADRFGEPDEIEESVRGGVIWH